VNPAHADRSDRAGDSPTGIRGPADRLQISAPAQLSRRVRAPRPRRNPRPDSFSRALYPGARESWPGGRHLPATRYVIAHDRYGGSRPGRERSCGLDGFAGEATSPDLLPVTEYNDFVPLVTVVLVPNVVLTPNNPGRRRPLEAGPQTLVSPPRPPRPRREGSTLASVTASGRR
jgi:hypothetical protein